MTENAFKIFVYLLQASFESLISHGLCHSNHSLNSTMNILLNAWILRKNLHFQFTIHSWILKIFHCCYNQDFKFPFTSKIMIPIKLANRNEKRKWSGKKRIQLHTGNHNEFQKWMLLWINCDVACVFYDLVVEREYKIQVLKMGMVFCRNYAVFSSSDD